MEIQLETAVARVTVYPDRARVTAQSECTVTPGIHRLLVNELPLAMETDSVRVAGSGTARVRLLGVDVKTQYYVETPLEKTRLLEQQIEQLEDDMRAIRDRKAGWQAHAKYLEGLRQATNEYAWGLARGRTHVEDQATLIQFLQTQDETLRTALRELEVQERTLNRQLEKLKQELKEIRSTRPRQRYQAQVEVEVLTEGDFRPEVSYVVREAGWKPLYDLRLQAAQEPVVEATYIAQVHQNSGQDWQGVQLTVSTARPALNQRLPELDPWYIDVFRPLPPPAMPMQTMAAPAAPTAMASRQAAPKMMMAEMAPAPVLAAEMAVAEVQESGTAVSYLITGQVDIPSDGSTHKTTIHQFQFPARLDYLAVPKHTDAVYRRATFNNTSPGPLLAGPANLFADDEFIGQTSLEYTPGGGELELLLGVEERITIARELARRDVDKRLLRDNRQLRYGYTITVKNLLPQPAPLEVHDHIPVSRHEQIRVKLEDARPQPGEKTDLNLLKWKVTLAAGVEQTIAYEYSVEHPRSLTVTGLLD